MTLLEAESLAKSLGHVALEDRSWLFLFKAAGRSMVARGTVWEEVFARAYANEALPEYQPDPVVTPGPLFSSDAVL